MNRKQSERQAQEGDREEFERLIRPFYHELNWFSFRQQDSDGACCSYQVDSYIEYGQKYGLSPLEYFQKIFHIESIWTKHLVFIKVMWSRALCINVVTHIGYGKGELKIVGGRGVTKQFMITPGGEKGNHLRKKLTFEWFLVYCICVGKPRLCPDSVVNPPENDPRGEMANEEQSRCEQLKTEEETDQGSSECTGETSYQSSETSNNSPEGKSSKIHQRTHRGPK
ncbi:uncharacterized protein LOC142349701 [Convolutriloba macropyga]|uniref:uncharacterized protein LOC142349701 n=1 Tax=Convolutriloba macropyga TaxID=536237 RepID=UPI003F526F30